MTIKLYDNDSYATSFDAVVIGCERAGDIYKTELDATLFFPEEGGQCADRGTIDGAEITQVELCQDTIYHYSAVPFEVGKTVHGEIDFCVRFRNMQNHSGEHIICGVAHKLFGYENVGFHLGPDNVTMDLSGELSGEDIEKIEYLANEAVARNMPVSARYLSCEEKKTEIYRAKGSIEGSVRLVTIGDIDKCACCAPHCETTGQIGLIKVTNVQNHRGGVRVNILCGKRAVADYTEKQNSVADISVQLSAKQNAVIDAVSRLKDENLRLKELGNTLQAQLLCNAVQALPSPEKSNHAILFVEIMNEIAIRNVINELVTKYQGFCAVFAGNDEGGYRFIIGSSTKDCRELAASLRSALQAKGGGSEPMIQGTIHSTRQEITNFFEHA